MIIDCLGIKITIIESLAVRLPILILWRRQVTRIYFQASKITLNVLLVTKFSVAAILNIFCFVPLVKTPVDYPLFMFWCQKFLLLICRQLGWLSPVLICWLLMPLHVPPSWDKEDERVRVICYWQDFFLVQLISVLATTPSSHTKTNTTADKYPK